VEMTQKDSEVIVEAIFDSLVRALRAGDRIEIRGLGSFGTRHRRPRVGRNPKTGARVEVPAKRIIYFQAQPKINGFGECRVHRRAIWPPADRYPITPYVATTNREPILIWTTPGRLAD
jgi:nucleoid DNA-binding protein